MRSRSVILCRLASTPQSSVIRTGQARTVEAVERVA
jgi:hypothetical protein